MLNFVGTLGAKALSFPGIFGLAAGMATRNYLLAAILGALIGALEAALFAGWNLALVEPLDAGLGVIVGLVAGLVGCAIRRKGTVRATSAETS